MWPPLQDQIDDFCSNPIDYPLRWYFGEHLSPAPIPRQIDTSSLYSGSGILCLPRSFTKASRVTKNPRPVKKDSPAKAYSMALAKLAKSTIMVYSCRYSLKLTLALANRPLPVQSLRAISLRIDTSEVLDKDKPRNTRHENKSHADLQNEPNSQIKKPGINPWQMVSFPDRCSQLTVLPKIEPLSSTNRPSNTANTTINHKTTRLINPSSKAAPIFDSLSDIPSNSDLPKPVYVPKIIKDQYEAYASGELPFRIISANIQNTRWMSLLSRNHDMLLLQETKYLQSSLLTKGYILESPNRSLIIWSKHKTVTLKNLDRLQILEVSLIKHKMIIANVHLSNLVKKRNAEIDEISQDFSHLKMNYTDANLVILGDFNAPPAQIIRIPLKRFESDQNT